MVLSLPSFFFLSLSNFFFCYNLVRVESQPPGFFLCVFLSSSDWSAPPFFFFLPLLPTLLLVVCVTVRMSLYLFFFPPPFEKRKKQFPPLPFSPSSSFFPSFSQRESSCHFLGPPAEGGRRVEKRKKLAFCHSRNTDFSAFIEEGQQFSICQSWGGNNSSRP